MSSPSIEERIALLETEVTQLKHYLTHTDAARAPWWEQIAGTFADDQLFDDAMDLG